MSEDEIYPQGNEFDEVLKALGDNRGLTVDGERKIPDREALAKYITEDKVERSRESYLVFLGESVEDITLEEYKWRDHDKWVRVRLIYCGSDLEYAQRSEGVKNLRNEDEEICYTSSELLVDDHANLTVTRIDGETEIELINDSDYSFLPISTDEDMEELWNELKKL